jgi:hypothetical protein
MDVIASGKFSQAVVVECNCDAVTVDALNRGGNRMKEAQVQNDQEQKTESAPTSSALAWVKPSFEVIGVSLECTAYAGTLEVEE